MRPLCWQWRLLSQSHQLANYSSTVLPPLTSYSSPPRLAPHNLLPPYPPLLDAASQLVNKTLPPLLATRLLALRSLPYIVATNPHLAHIANVYETSLTSILDLGESLRINHNEKGLEHLVHVLRERTMAHADTIHRLAMGMVESKRYLNGEEMNTMVKHMIEGRITSSLAVEQFLALFTLSSSSSKSNRWSGIVDTELCPAEIVKRCEEMVGDICEFRYGLRPRVKINGLADYRFAQIPAHLEYIITELLKNAFRAVLEHHKEQQPIHLTIAPSPASDKSSKEERITIRIRDQGGGIPPQAMKNIWDFSFTTFNEHDSDARGDAANTDFSSVIANNTGGTSTLAGLGYGLPLGRAYAEYFGGSIDIVPMWGWGTDVYLSLRGIY